MLKFIFCTLIICSLYTGELFVITSLFMPRAMWQWKSIVIHGVILACIYARLIYVQGISISDNVWYIGLTAFVINNLLHEGKLKTRIWVFFMTYAISVGGEGIVSILLDKLYNAIGYTGTGFITDDVLPHLCAFGVAVGVSRLLKKEILYQRNIRDYDALSWPKCIGLSLISIIYAVVFNLISLMYIYQENVQLGSRVIFFGVYFTLFLIVLAIRHHQRKLKKEYASREAGILKGICKKSLTTYNHLEEIEQGKEDIKQEVEKEIEELTRLIGEKESKRLSPYIESIRKRLPYKMTKVITGNEIVNMIFHEKEIRAKELGITFETNVSIPNTLKLSIVDVCIIIDCIMDYTIKMCMQGSKKQKKIKVKGLWFKGYLMFEIWYTLEEKEEIQRIGYIKEPDELIPVIKCLKKYDGNIEITQEDHLGKIELNFNTVGGVTCCSYNV